jgi:hypothetical protein
MNSVLLSSTGKRRERRLPVLIAAAILAGTAGWLWHREQLAREARASRAAAEAAFGIKVERLGLSAAGYMLDLRYRVTDAAKAAPLLDRKVKPYVLAGTDMRLEVPQTPTVGTLKQSTRTPREGQIYFAMLANPGKVLKSGDRVTLVMGDFKATGLQVK